MGSHGILGWLAHGIPGGGPTGSQGWAPPEAQGGPLGTHGTPTEALAGPFGAHGTTPGGPGRAQGTQGPRVPQLVGTSYSLGLPQAPGKL